MKVGTKSLLYGAHCFMIHPIVVFIAWWKLYGFPYDPRLWVAFFVHDLGYWGKPNMDGEEGEKHPELGAKIMHVFDWLIPVRKSILHIDKTEHNSMIDAGWKIVRKKLSPQKEWLYEFATYKKRIRLVSWRNLSLYHSRFYAKRNNAQYSKLCVADKMAFCIEPYWLYVIKATLTGEIKEYMYVHTHGDNQTKKEWHTQATSYTRLWVEEHKDLREDTWTN